MGRMIILLDTAARVHEDTSDVCYPAPAVALLRLAAIAGQVGIITDDGS
jgi:hypothetical protein